MRTWGLAALTLGCALLAACSDDDVPAPAPAAVPSAAVTVAATGDVAAQQALALVPQEARVLTVTDFARIRDQLGDDGQRPEALWERAERAAPMLTRGMFRDGASLTQREVLWEAHFGSGGEGYVVRFADDVDLTRLAAPPGARLRPGDHLLVSGVATDPAASWAAVPGLAELVPADAEATYLERGCVPGEAGSADLDPLTAYSVSFGSSTATVRLGSGRRDLFARLRLGEELPTFARGYADGAADPSTGRIGYTLVDPPVAADLALRHRLPFAVCAAG